MDLINSFSHLQKKVKEFLQPREFAEIWKAALAFLKDKRTEALSADRTILPFNDIMVTVRANPEQRTRWEPLLNSFDPTTEAVSYFRDQKIEVAGGLRVEVKLVEESPSDWAPDALFDVQTGNIAGARAAAKAGPGRRELRVEQGNPGTRVYELAGDEICIGRCQIVRDKYGRIVRRNDVYFIDDQSEINSSVSQEHARIRGDRQSGDFYLFDTSSNGTQIFRSGRAIQVPPGEGTGVRLQDGDEIYFGKAMARYHIKDDPNPKSGKSVAIPD